MVLNVDTVWMQDLILFIIIAIKNFMTSTLTDGSGDESSKLIVGGSTPPQGTMNKKETIEIKLYSCRVHFFYTGHGPVPDPNCKICNKVKYKYKKQNAKALREASKKIKP